MKITSLRVTVCVILFTAVCSLAFILKAEDEPNEDVEEVLKLHGELLESHMKYDAHGVLAAEPDDIVVVSRGEVLFPSKVERIFQYEQYLKSTEFKEYRDLIRPIVRVSDDGTLGWLIAQVRIVGTRSRSNGEKTPIDSVWAWIELYEKRDGRWFRVGEVSNVKSQD